VKIRGRGGGYFLCNFANCVSLSTYCSPPEKEMFPIFLQNLSTEMEPGRNTAKLVCFVCLFVCLFTTARAIFQQFGVCQQKPVIANFMGPKKKRRYNRNLLYKERNMLKFYRRGFHNLSVIAVNSLYSCLLYSSFAVYSTSNWKISLKRNITIYMSMCLMQNAQFQISHVFRYKQLLDALKTVSWRVFVT
jgi:hypothetical protein